MAPACQKRGGLSYIWDLTDIETGRRWRGGSEGGERGEAHQERMCDPSLRINFIFVSGFVLRV